MRKLTGKRLARKVRAGKATRLEILRAISEVMKRRRENMKQQRITVIRPDGTVTTRVYAADLAEFQKLVGGFIENVPMLRMYEKRKCVAYCNEDGKAKALPINEKATTVWWENTIRHQTYRDMKREDMDDLRGTVVIVQAV